MLKRMKSYAKSVFPFGAEAIAKSKEKVLSSYRGDGYVPSVFTEIYRENLWENNESRSGRSSTIDATNIVREQIPVMLKKLGVRTMLDAPCGDFNWMQHTPLDIEKYIGADIVPEMIARNQELYASKTREFRVIDITKDEIPTVDLILCRDCLIHFSIKYIADALANFKRSGSKYLLTTTYTRTPDNKDIQTGDCRFLNLQIAPFHLPETLDFIVEESEHGKSLGLWRIADL